MQYVERGRIGIAEAHPASAIHVGVRAATLVTAGGVYEESSTTSSASPRSGDIMLALPGLSFPVFDWLPITTPQV